MSGFLGPFQPFQPVWLGFHILPLLQLHPNGRPEHRHGPGGPAAWRHAADEANAPAAHGRRPAYGKLCVRERVLPPLLPSPPPTRSRADVPLLLPPLLPPPPPPRRHPITSLALPQGSSTPLSAARAGASTCPAATPTTSGTTTSRTPSIVTTTTFQTPSPAAACG